MASRGAVSPRASSRDVAPRRGLWVAAEGWRRALIADGDAANHAGRRMLRSVAAYTALIGLLLFTRFLLGMADDSLDILVVAVSLGMYALLAWSWDRLTTGGALVVALDMAEDDEVAELRAHADELQRQNRELEEAREHLEWQASRDAVTGLLGRRAITERAELELQRARRGESTCSLIVLDVDRLKNINDRYGHLVGDQILCEVARRLDLSSGLCSAIGRWGGDEFLVVVSGASRDLAEMIGKRLQRSVYAEPVRCRDDLSVEISVSVGLGFAEPDELITFNELFHRADMAMYDVKHRGSTAAMPTGHRRRDAPSERR
jgi:diguanylate cyclase (GGDEF)-like protein